MADEKHDRPQVIPLRRNSEGLAKEKMTRSEVATLLSVSISTVRRMEGRQLHPEVDGSGVRWFRSDEVRAVAGTMSTRLDISGQQELSQGEIAARIFECFEQRQSLAEIVRELRVSPKRVRALYHEWRTCLELGELQRKDPAPVRTTAQTVAAGAVDNLDELLATLPREPVRISVAEFATSWIDDCGDDARVYAELGGFVTTEGVTMALIQQRYGTGQFRVSAYALHESRLLWEVYVCIHQGESAEYLARFRRQ